VSVRLTVRFSRAYQVWIAELGGDQADAVRALMVLGAASLGLNGAQREALRLLEADLPPDVGTALLVLADKRQTSGRHTADTPKALLIKPHEPPEEPEIDPFMAAGIEV
jgi:hypothetical protein